MTDAPKLHLFAVSAAFSDGIGGVYLGVGYRVEEVVAQAVLAATRTEPSPHGDLIGVYTREVPVEALRAFLQAIETGQPSTARVVPLHAVPPEQQLGDQPAASPPPTEPPAA